MSYEYKVVPAPVRGLKAKGLKTAEDRFANALESAINALAADGWEYLRADTLPCEKREGLMGKTTTFQNMLVFRRAKAAATVSPARAEPTLAAPAKPVATPEVEGPTQIADDPAPMAGKAAKAPAKPDSAEVAAE